MNRIVLLVCILFIRSNLGFGQYIKSATIASSGAVLSNSSGRYISQVIGQSSAITGTAKSNNAIFRQGFKQPNFSQKRVLKLSNPIANLEENTWKFEAYPNPFKDEITIRLNRPSTNSVEIQLISIQGALAWSGTFPEQSQEILLQKFERIPAGKYILNVIQQGKIQTQSIIKQSL